MAWHPLATPAGFLLSQRLQLSRAWELGAPQAGLCPLPPPPTFTRTSGSVCFCVYGPDQWMQACDQWQLSLNGMDGVVRLAIH